MREAEAHGATLNRNFSQSETTFPEGRVLREFTYTSYLDDADVIINFCKLKSHGMMGMSCAAKNMFGTVPGVIKPEYHYRFPKYEDFADMIVDLDEYFHPVISIADAVIGMEGNGPTAGTPKKMGCILASHSPHNLDMVAAKIIGFERAELPILEAAYRRGMVPESVEDVPTLGSLDSFILGDFERVVERRSLEFTGDGKNKIKVIFGKIASKILRTKPSLKPELCVGCGVCANICPAKAIVINKKKKAVINRKTCIRCFCCQEFCPKSAMKVKRTLLASIFHRQKSR
jgi:ferredoxin